MYQLVLFDILQHLSWPSESIEALYHVILTQLFSPMSGTLSPSLNIFFFIYIFY